MSSRQKLRTTNDIFEMVSENDEDIKFDECGILKPVTLSKSTIVVVYSFTFFFFNIKYFFFSLPMITLIHLHLKQPHHAIVIVCIYSKFNLK